MDFVFWFQTGIGHIADLNGYDHILFLIALTAPYTHNQFRKLLILVTAFTVGHSISLALSVTGVISVSPSVVEFLIPATILISSLLNLTGSSSVNSKFAVIQYSLVSFFGLIHGLGFSYLLKSMLGGGKDLLLPLFSFNMGLEAGQILIVASILFVGYLLQRGFRLKEKEVIVLFSLITLVMSLILLIDRFPDFIQT